MFNLTSADTANFADVNASDYFAAELAIARNNGIINGKNGKIDPMASATRAEVAVMLYRVLDLVK